MSTRTLNYVNRKIREVEAIEEQIAALQKSRRTLLDKIHDKCPHPPESVREAPCEPNAFGTGAIRPFRVCLVCGLAEEGWGCGYDQLHRDYIVEIKPMTRDEARQHVRTRRNQDEMWRRRQQRRKNQLLRKAS